MTTKMLAVRTPESMHTYLKVAAYKKGSSIQELVNEILADHQAKDPEYQGALNDLVTDSLTALASITQDEEVSRGV